MSNELIEKLREDGKFLGGNFGKLMHEAADALEARAAPVGEREAFEAWAKSTPQGTQLRYVRDALPVDDPRYGEYVSEALRLSWEAWQARSAYQRAQQPQSAEAVAYVLTRDGEVCYEADDGIVISNTPGDETDLYKWQPVYFTTPQPSAGVVIPELVRMLERATDELDCLNCAFRDQIDDDMAEPDEEAEACDAVEELIAEARELIERLNGKEVVL